MFKKLSLKNKLALSASIAIIIGGFLVELMSFQASLKHMDTEVFERLKSSTASYNQYVSDWIKSKEQALTSIEADANMDSIVSNLKQVKNSAKLDNVFLAYPDGSQDNANGVVLPAGNDDPRKWGWYINAMKNPAKVFMDNPTVAAATGANVVSLGSAVNLGGQQVVLGADVEITDIIAGLDKVILPGEGYMFIANQQGNVFTHKDTKLLNQSVQKLGLDFSVIKQSMSSGDDIEAEVNGQTSVIYAVAIEGTPLITVTVLNRSSLLKPLFSSLWGQIAVTILVVIVCTFLFNLLCSILFRPLNHVSNALDQIANGSGDLTQRIKVASNDEVGRLANNFNLFVGSMQKLIAHIREQSGKLSDQSEVSDERAHRNVEGIHHQQQEITMVATAVTEMASATAEIASHAEKTAKSAQDSAKNTEDGNAIVLENKNSINRLANELQQASNVVGELNKHSQDISTILATIQGIAEQTNLLALNAAIEAARAGEQGRGFAVVADEVRVLSQRTHDSTEEIKVTIDTLQETTSNAVKLMENSSELAVHSVEDADKASVALEEINTAVQNIRGMATQIATAAEQQAQVTNEVTQNITSIKDFADQLVGDAKESSQEAANVKALSSEITGKVSTFKL